eukprot:CAMPEP_0182547050 /NCGR_PEP_ID=MMETSP1323-20130603/36930_1 /TAXON_ID=236787 /ORGANISM="Florenciella parvula, Strain RCC1693" /LENGTH=69 /DNA_ID=CAMNT_0024758323 /DNA_START=35 /DNA_END=241 /DNA_ORIENTATION=-
MKNLPRSKRPRPLCPELRWSSPKRQGAPSDHQRGRKALPLGAGTPQRAPGGGALRSLGFINTDGKAPAA